MKNFLVFVVLYGALLGIVRGDNNIYGPGGVNLGPDGDPQRLYRETEQQRQQQQEAANKSNPGSAKVELYITSWCPYCKRAMAFLRANNIPFTSYDIEEDLNAAARKKQLDPNYGGVPLAIINGQMIRGFNEDEFRQALKMN